MGGARIRVDDDDNNANDHFNYKTHISEPEKS